MQLDRVTITGADNSISPEARIIISQAYPWVEWGILVSASSQGAPRFPTGMWIFELQELARQHLLQLSLHICGRWVRKLLTGINELPVGLLGEFQRVQLNFHAERTLCIPQNLWKALQNYHDRQFIFQLDDAGGNAHLEALLGENPLLGPSLDAVALFDTSGGAGILPSAWPQPVMMANDTEYAYHGYAGGLGPDNLAEQL